VLKITTHKTVAGYEVLTAAGLKVFCVLPLCDIGKFADVSDIRIASIIRAIIALVIA
jgi:hypothetical protein